MRDYFTGARMATVKNTDYSENTGTLMLHQQKGEMVYSSWQAGWQFLRVKHSVIMYLSVWAIKTPTSKLGHECQRSLVQNSRHTKKSNGHQLMNEYIKHGQSMQLSILQSFKNEALQT